MPYNPGYDPTLLTNLASPVANPSGAGVAGVPNYAPPSVGADPTTQNFQAMTQGAGVTPGYGTGEVASPNEITGAAAADPTASTGGTVGMQEISQEIFTPEKKDALTAQTEEFTNTLDEGYTDREGNTYEAGDRKGARKARSDDRKDDRERRQRISDMKKDDLKEEFDSDMDSAKKLKGGEKRRAKKAARKKKRKAKKANRRSRRNERRSQRKTRTSAWKEYKSERDMTNEDVSGGNEGSYSTEPVIN